MKPKWAMAIGTLTYALFEVGFLCLNEIFLYSTSLLLGFGAAILWTGQGTYLAQNCEPNDSSRNSAVLCMMGQLSSLFSGIFLLIVFQSAESKHDILPSTIRILYGTFTGLSILAALIIVFQRTPPYEDRGKKDARNYKELLGSTAKLALTKEMLIFMVSLAYSGIAVCYMSGVFPTCISSTTKLNYNTNALMAWSSIFSGIGQLIAGVIQGKLGNKIQQFGREKAILLGTILQILAYALSYANFPNDSANMKTEKLGNLLYPNITIAMIISVLLGVGDSIWNAQSYSVLIDTYPDKSSEAFAVRMFYKVIRKDSQNTNNIIVGHDLRSIFLHSIVTTALAVIDSGNFCRNWNDILRYV
ncbi:hypothetical protein WR25_12137 isoform B [Diploscapter pachys]|uniref:Major facilitator superfamily (MFS) profile domain-containing protein n=2 Tax=Diploscapter pachys TaxID=2018661 RepID=A0A2A2K3W4_9BILA|nr:hypothetical protein WR25_12137 isoform B [Diploscapter pachys]